MEVILGEEAANISGYSIKVESDRDYSYLNHCLEYIITNDWLFSSPITLNVRI